MQSEYCVLQLEDIFLLVQWLEHRLQSMSCQVHTRSRVRYAQYVVLRFKLRSRSDQPCCNSKDSNFIVHYFTRLLVQFIVTYFTSSLLNILQNHDSTFYEFMVQFTQIYGSIGAPNIEISLHSVMTVICLHHILVKC